MIMKNVFGSWGKVLGFLPISALLVGCSVDSVRETMGMGKRSPDEYLIVERAPLSVPPSYELRPPSASDLEAQYASLRKRAQDILIGSANGGEKPMSESELAFLSDAGALNSGSEIRHIIDTESGVRFVEDDRFVDELMFWTDKEGTEFIVDPVAEAERLRRNALSGMPVTYGASPTIERKN
jgi:hypothetical protein|tara:strand:- start:726 stop:1271 length:546 start_codon:yes stop_codon:yes gene_type:complete